MSRLHSIVAIVLFFVCALPGFAVAPPACAPEFSFDSISAHDVQIGQPVTVTWSYSGKPVIAQTIDVSGVGYGIQLGVNQRTYTYVPAKTGETHVQVNASSGCDFVKAETQFHVRQCNIAPREMTLQDEQVLPGQPFSASVVLQKNESVRWEVNGGSVVFEDGGSVSLVAGPPGSLDIAAYVSKGGNCELRISRSVPIVCPPLDVEISVSADEAIAGFPFSASITPQPEWIVRWEVSGGTLETWHQGGAGILAGGPGTLVIDVYITRDGCETKVSRSVPIVCDDRPLEMTLNGPQVIAGDTFGATVPHYPGQTVRWEVRGATIKQTDLAGVSIITSAPGTLEIDAYVTRNGFCERKISRSVPIVCYSDPDRVITMQPSVTQPGGTVLAFVNVFPWFNETVRYEVRNGTIDSIDGLNVWITAGTAGTLEMDAYITHGGCTFKVSKSIPVQ